MILGGGLSGLSVAVRLASCPDLRVTVIEPRTAYVRDKTWSYWRLLEHPFDDAVAASWPAWDLRRTAPDGTVRVTGREEPSLPYQTIPSDRLYAVAEARLRAAPNVDLRLGCSVLSVAEHRDGVVVETTDGTIRAAYALDSRPPPAGPEGDLVQRFVGQEVSVARPVFDPGRVTLMDFAVRQKPGLVRFLYVLPFSATEALVEDTWLAPADAVLPDHRAAIRDYLAERYGVSDYDVSFEEAGAIPMSPSLQAPARAGRIVPIGTAGGAVKPSSGYGFLAIQRMADAVAADLAAGRAPRPFATRSAASRWMDEVFLLALRHGPERAGEIFESLFARCRPGRLLRFLNDIPNALDIADVVAGTPKAPMLAAAARSVFGGR